MNGEMHVQKAVQKKKLYRVNVEEGEAIHTS